MSFILKYRRLKVKLLCYYWIIQNLIIIKTTKNIVAKGKIRIAGKTEFRLHPTALLSFGNNVRVVSGLNINPIGRQQFSYFRLDKNAKVEIGNDVGMAKNIFGCTFQTISDTIKYVYENRQDALQKSDNAFKRLLSFFDEDIICRQYIDLYSQNL
jgi:hypothetical protein